MKKFFAFAAIALATSHAFADQAVLTPEKVMTGNSSAFSDGVFVRVAGQVGPATCYYAGFSTSMFYVRPSGTLDSKKALAILMAAKLTGRNVEIVYNANSTQADFFGYGITNCEISELVLD